MIATFANPIAGRWWPRENDTEPDFMGYPATIIAIEQDGTRTFAHIVNEDSLHVRVDADEVDFMAVVPSRVGE